MAHSKYDVKHPDLKNSALHHDLKNQPGGDGDPDHAKADDETWISDETAKTIKSKKSDGTLGSALKEAVADDTEDKS